MVHADPPAGGNWKVLPEFTDEFNGNALDDKKWHDYHPGWAGRKPGFFSRANVTVKDGALRLTARAENLEGLPDGFHSYTTAAVHSRTYVKYGYFEVRCKAMNSLVSSAFWFTNHTADEWTEIAVFEISGASKKYENKVVMTTHLFKNKDYAGTADKHIQDSYQWGAPFRPADGFHTYALEWSKDYLKWYVDGKVVRITQNLYWHQALGMNFDSETFPTWFGLPDVAELPATFTIDYVRSWASSETEIAQQN
jgi:beta-glucanase (GH16 family)